MDDGNIPMTFHLFIFIFYLYPSFSLLALCEGRKQTLWTCHFVFYCIDWQSRLGVYDQIGAT